MTGFCARTLPGAGAQVEVLANMTVTLFFCCWRMPHVPARLARLRRRSVGGKICMRVYGTPPSALTTIEKVGRSFCTKCKNEDSFPHFSSRDLQVMKCALTRLWCTGFCPRAPCTCPKISAKSFVWVFSFEHHELHVRDDVGGRTALLNLGFDSNCVVE